MNERRHLNFFQYETYLHARVPRVRCGSYGIKQVEVPWARQAVDLSDLRQLGIDECSLRKGYVYMTSFGDLEASHVVFDRFHVMNQLNKAIERVRWEEQRENMALTKSRFLGIVNFLDARVTNRMIEGLNS